MPEGVRAGTYLKGWRERIPDCRSCNTETTGTMSRFLLGGVNWVVNSLQFRSHVRWRSADDALHVTCRPKCKMQIFVLAYRQYERLLLHFVSLFQDSRGLSPTQCTPPDARRNPTVSSRRCRRNWSRRFVTHIKHECNQGQSRVFMCGRVIIGWSFGKGA